MNKFKLFRTLKAHRIYLVIPPKKAPSTYVTLLISKIIWFFMPLSFHFTMLTKFIQFYMMVTFFCSASLHYYTCQVYLNLFLCLHLNINSFSLFSCRLLSLELILLIFSSIHWLHLLLKLFAVKYFGDN